MRNRQRRERGAALFVMGAMLLILLGMSALAVDLALHYVVRSQAQRAADAGALAGAQKFVTSGYLSGAVTQAEAEDLAREQAKTVGAANLVGGELALVLDSDVTFDFSNPDNPLITVAVQRVASRGNAMPTLFAKAIGIVESNISAVATAEAYTPSGGGIPTGTGCIKPWIFPNCDPAHTTPENPYCPGAAYFVDTSTGEVMYPGTVANGGVIGVNMTIKHGDPQEAPAPSQFYPVQIPPGDEPTLCPDCAKITSSDESPGAAVYRMNISCCNTNQFVCGQEVELDEQTGDMVGPTAQGVQCLIHQDNMNCGTSADKCGQDYLPDPPNNPWRIIGGTSHPVEILRGQPMSSSESLVTVPLYEGYPLEPGESGEFPLVKIIGFLQFFIEKVGPPQGTVTAHIMNVAGCGSGGSGGDTGGSGSTDSSEEGSGSGGSSFITGPAGSPFPVRLVRPGS